MTTVGCITGRWGLRLSQSANVRAFVRESRRHVSILVLALERHARSMPRSLRAGQVVVTRAGPFEVATRCTRRGVRTRVDWYDQTGRWS